MGKFLLIEYRINPDHKNSNSNKKREIEAERRTEAKTGAEREAQQPIGNWDTIGDRKDIAIIGCPPQQKGFAAEIMLKKLAKDWADGGFETKLLLVTHANIFQKVANCYPRQDTEGWGFDVSQLSVEQVESLFLKKIDFEAMLRKKRTKTRNLNTRHGESGNDSERYKNGKDEDEYEDENRIELQDCDLLDLLKVDPIPQKSQKEEDVSNPPPPTSGDTEVDLLAALTNCLESYEQATMVCKTLSLSDIYKFLRQLNELRRDPEERLNEWLADEFAAYKTRKGAANYAKDVLGLGL